MKSYQDLMIVRLPNCPFLTLVFNCPTIIVWCERARRGCVFFSVPLAIYFTKLWFEKLDLRWWKIVYRKKRKQVFQPIYLFVQWLSILCDSNYFAFVLANWQTQRTAIEIILPSKLAKYRVWQKNYPIGILENKSTWYLRNSWTTNLDHLSSLRTI